MFKQNKTEIPRGQHIASLSGQLSATAPVDGEVF